MNAWHVTSIGVFLRTVQFNISGIPYNTVILVTFHICIVLYCMYVVCRYVCMYIVTKYGKCKTNYEYIIIYFALIKIQKYYE